MRRFSRDYADRVLRQQQERFDSWVLAAEAAGDDVTVRPSRPRILHEKITTQALRWVAVVRTPWFDERTREAEWGFGSLKCLREGVGSSPDGGRSLRRIQVLFSAASFKEHWKKCERRMNPDISPDSTPVAPA